MVSHSLRASLSTRNRPPHHASISGMNGSPSSSPFSSSVARISSELRTSTISPTRRAAARRSGVWAFCTLSLLSGSGRLWFGRPRARATARNTAPAAASGSRGGLIRPTASRRARRGLRVGGAVHRRRPAPSVYRVDDDPVHAVMHDRADRSRHRRHDHRRTGAQRLHHDAADEVLQGREHERLAGLEGALEA